MITLATNFNLRAVLSSGYSSMNNIQYFLSWKKIAYLDINGIDWVTEWLDRRTVKILSHYEKKARLCEGGNTINT